MIDYHLHLWPHGSRDIPPTVEQLALYCEKAQANGVTEIAITEHLFRFVQADRALSGFWNNDSNRDLAHQMEKYWSEHARADLDTYVECVLQAKRAGLPIILGLEVDYYRDQMDKVSELLSDYPFDVLLGSVHWLGAWGFDDISCDIVMDEWEVRDIEKVWDDYTISIEELAQSQVCDVLAHPDLVKITGRFPRVPEEFYDRMAAAAISSTMVAELSSAGWRKPVAEQYPNYYLLKRFVEAGVGITTASDAHKVNDVSDNANKLKGLLDSVGCEVLTGFRSRKSYEIKL